MSLAQPIFDTLKYVAYLEDHGFSERQARGLAEMQVMITDAQEARLATKHDIEINRVQLENKIDEARLATMHDLEINRVQLESKIDNVRLELDNVRLELESKIDKLRIDLESKIQKAIHRSTLFLFTSMVSIMGIGIGIIAIMLNGLR